MIPIKTEKTVIIMVYSIPLTKYGAYFAIVLVFCAIFMYFAASGKYFLLIKSSFSTRLIVLLTAFTKPDCPLAIATAFPACSSRKSLLTAIKLLSFLAYALAVNSSITTPDILPDFKAKTKLLILPKPLALDFFI